MLTKDSRNLLHRTKPYHNAKFANPRTLKAHLTQKAAAHIATAQIKGTEKQ